jgi:DDE superfamily endonuclease
MSQPLAAIAAPGPLEAYCQHFDALFDNRSQKDGFRRYQEGLLLPLERNKTLTALANAEPIIGAQNPRVQTLQWFLSESNWSASALHKRRLELLLADPLSAPNTQGVLVIDETGDRKDGTKTAHVARQYLANLGKVDNGVVSVSSLWADERLYYPLEVEPYTPACYFQKGKSDPAFRTKPQIALELVQQALRAAIPFRAVVADSFYGENEQFRNGLERLKVGYVLALKPSFAWWHLEGAIGSLWEAAKVALWQGPKEPGDWRGVVRTFGDGHREPWWALEVKTSPFGPDKPLRAVVVSTDPEQLPEHSTWYLVSNLPAPDSARAQESALAPASLEEIVRLYGLRLWIEQSYKQVKHALGWAQYQVRRDVAIRRHWALVCCAFSFCWWHQSHACQKEAMDDKMDDKVDGQRLGSDLGDTSQSHTPAPEAPAPLEEAGREKNRGRAKRWPIRGPASDVLAAGVARGAGVAGAVGHAVALLAGVVGSAPAAGTGASA